MTRSGIAVPLIRGHVTDTVGGSSATINAGGSTGFAGTTHLQTIGSSTSALSAIELLVSIRIDEPFRNCDRPTDARGSARHVSRSPQIVERRQQ